MALGAQVYMYLSSPPSYLCAVTYITEITKERLNRDAYRFFPRWEQSCKQKKGAQFVPIGMPTVNSKT